MKKAVKYFSILAVTAAVIMTSSCGGRNSRHEERKSDSVREMLEKYLTSLSPADTAEVKTLSSQFLTYLSENSVDDAVAMLYQSDGGGKPVKVDSATVAVLKRRNEIFPVRAFSVNAVKFLSPDNNAVTYTVMFDNGNPPSTTRWAFNPVKYDGKWYLTLSD